MYFSSETLRGMSLGGGVISLSGYSLTGIGTMAGDGLGGFLGAGLEGSLLGAGDSECRLLGDSDLVLGLSREPLTLCHEL